MTATMTDPVVEAEVLTALDFDTPPVEVKTSVVDNKVIWSMPPGAVLTISAGNVEWTVAEGKFEMAEVKEQEPLTFEMLSKAYINWGQITPKPCDCPLCLRHDGSPMDPTAKALWVEALRDPDRKQGRGALRRGDLWCALGVLIDVAIRAGVKVRVSEDSSGATLYDGMGGALPPSVRKWAGLRGDPTANGSPVALMNDSGMTFPVIADLIERHL
jgi:hypothetical protein